MINHKFVKKGAKFNQIIIKMEVIYITIGVSVIIAILFFIAFIMSVKSGQYDDIYTPSVRMLFDDELVTEKKNKCEKNNKELTNK